MPTRPRSLQPASRRPPYRSARQPDRGRKAPRTTIGAMAKRLMIAVVGAGIGVLAGLLVDSMGAGTPALVIGAVAGALIPQFLLGPPGH